MALPLYPAILLKSLLLKSGAVGAARFHRARKERAGMTNILLIIAILLLADIYGQLKKLLLLFPRTV